MWASLFRCEMILNGIHLFKHHTELPVIHSIWETHGLVWFHCTHRGLLRLPVSRSRNSSRTGDSRKPSTNEWLLYTDTLTTGEFSTGWRGNLQGKIDPLRTHFLQNLLLVNFRALTLPYHATVISRGERKPSHAVSKTCKFIFCIFSNFCLCCFTGSRNTFGGKRYLPSYTFMHS